MIKSVLVPAAGTDDDAAASAAALAIVRLFGAHLDVLHVRFDATTAALAMATDGGSGAMTAGLIDRLEEDARQRETSARETFDRFCAQNRLAAADAPSEAGAMVTAEWHVEIGEEPRWMASWGRSADLIVVPRAGGDAETSRATLEAVLLETGRPLLIPAAAAIPTSIDRIAIAWKPTREAACAVALAMPFLLRAKQIAVLTVAEQPDELDEVDRLARNLARHGLSAKAEQLAPGSDGVAAALLAAARERADLLVMGGYGHSRLREAVFGGVTHEVLTGAPLPVLMAH